VRGTVPRSAYDVCQISLLALRIPIHTRLSDMTPGEGDDAHRKPLVHGEAPQAREAELLGEKRRLIARNPAARRCSGGALGSYKMRAGEKRHKGGEDGSM
jgi:hypothetical protein